MRPPTFTHIHLTSPLSQGLTLCLLSPALGVTPPVRIESSSSHVAEGQTLDLNCLVAGQAHAQIMWHKRGGSLPARHQVGGRELRGSLKAPHDYRRKYTGFDFRHI